ncbi:anaerobic ribonucleoside-triphosphate reductase activating protein [Xylanimonas cellulosilytica DSM 15894]|uniref:Anaerobic ribonucleoside-triphosphate reductase activating protein n=1 Tax=Xylanimonas cellulosilytica (strain DSM 15894 / JCM 12276 / CECT 5975 / KCTC 9989 / LMG 20990 / NBRC 107835 / XIL07) TaxID=446471 RepID=D1BU26_XYLCX|nr:anaerobic ribonucleoside-triphosphate reductase activating protein [Xylanimonas cellulosilytica DSM 15894]
MVEPPAVVAGLVRLSTVDWPGKLAAVVFLQGCPWRCVYCHNEEILDPREPGTMPWFEVVEFLRRRRGLLDGVVFSGGEPLLSKALPTAIGEVRNLGFAVGLHTGGAWPRRLQALLDDGALDWVGLDVKHLPERYASVTGVPSSGAAAWASLEAVLASGVSHEVRTTVDPTVHTRPDVVALAERLAALGVQHHALQEARPDGLAAGHAEAFAGWRLADLLAPDDLPHVERRAA